MKHLYLGAVLSALSLSLSFHFASAQINVPNSSQEKVKKAIEEHDKGNYKESIKLLSTIPYGDSTYLLARYELGLSYQSDSQYNAALKTHTSIRGNTNPIKRDLIIALGNTYSMMNDKKTALAYYDSAKVLFPHDHRAYYESAVVHLNNEDKEKAIESLQKAALINPNHFRTHWLLGITYATQGRLVESFLANMFALTNSTNENTGFMSVNVLTELSDLGTEMTEFYQNKSSKHEHELFDEINELMASRIIFNKDFKTRGKIDDKIIKQFQLITEKLKYDTKDNNFAMQYYVPLILEIEKNNLFEDFILYTFSDLNIEEIDKLNSGKKAKGQLNKVHDIVSNYKKNILGTREVNYANRKLENIKYLSSPKNNIFIEGKPLNDSLNAVVGNATIYLHNNKLSEGKYDNKGERIGQWKFYHNNGNLKVIENYKDGHTRNKEKIRYHENGNMAMKINYTADSTLKDRTDYDYMGRKFAYQTKNKDGNFDYTSYHHNGKVKEKFVYLRNSPEELADGTYTTFHNNGNINKKFSVVNKELDGLYEVYYSDGTLRAKYIYKNGELHGPFSTYYSNGKEDKVGNFENGEKDGLIVEYYEHKSEYFTENFRNGKRHGQTIFYNKDKQPYGWITYNNNVPVSYKYQDQTGKVISSEENNRGLTNLPQYNEYGVLIKSTPYNADGLFHGEQFTYYNNGKIKSKIMFAKGYSDGPKTTFTDKGALYSNSTNTEGKETGIYTSYYDNGKIRITGMVEEDENVGLWTKYYKNGQKSNVYFLVDGDFNGDDSTFYYTGKPKSIEEYDQGSLVGFLSLDTNGKVIDNIQFPKGNGNLVHNYPNGKIKRTVPIVYGTYNGIYKEFSPTGELISEYVYENGKLNGEFKNWHPNGKLSSEGKYINGQIEGILKHYDEAGQLVETTTYKNGKLNGLNELYKNGIKVRSYKYAGNEKNGKSTFYGDNNTVIAHIFYQEDNVVGYSWIDKNGAETPMVPINKGTGKIKTYYPSGQLAFSAEWKEGYYHNEFVIYYSNGQKFEQKNYEIGNVIGTAKTWSETGQLLSASNYNKDGLTGIFTKYDKTGKKIAEYQYFQDIKHGKAEFIGKNGAPLIVNYYYNDLH